MPRLLARWILLHAVVGCAAMLALGCTAASSSGTTTSDSASAAPSTGRDETSPFPMGTPTPPESALPSIPTNTASGVHLEVDRSKELTLLGRSADKGSVFLVVSLHVENESEVSSPPPLFAWSLLSLRTKAGLNIGVSKAGVTLPDACPDDVPLPKGAMLACSIAFEVPQGEAKSLVLAIPPSSSVEALVVPPLQCNIATPSRVLPAPVRVSHDNPPALIREALPDGTFTLVRGELYTMRDLPHFAIPASTVVIRDSMFQEVVFDHVVSRTMGRLDDSPEGTSVRISCASPTPSPEQERDVVPDTLYYSKVERELVLERSTPDGILRRIYH